MVYAEVLKDIGMPADEIAEFNRLEEAGEFAAQERMLRAYRQRYLDDVHRGERIISTIDYVLHEMRKNQKSFR